MFIIHSINLIYKMVKNADHCSLKPKIMSLCGLFVPKQENIHVLRSWNQNFYIIPNNHSNR